MHYEKLPDVGSCGGRCVLFAFRCFSYNLTEWLFYLL
jgi:hypothetical protein